MIGPEDMPNPGEESMVAHLPPGLSLERLNELIAFYEKEANHYEAHAKRVLASHGPRAGGKCVEICSKWAKNGRDVARVLRHLLSSGETPCPGSSPSPPPT